MPIAECGEPMAALPLDAFAFFRPHPYQAVGAPYGGASPWQLRQSNVAALLRAQTRLQAIRPGWRLLIFNAYRPNAVQVFMVEREFALVAQSEGLKLEALTPAQRDRLAPKVYRIWGIPDENPAAPPLHSTGGSVDLTFADETGQAVDLGSPIDENSDRSQPDYFADAVDQAGRTAHAHRLLLQAVMEQEGFVRLRDEWWHFDRGGQYDAWHRRETGSDPAAVARYGRADLL